MIKMVERDGWRWIITEGSHRQFKHPSKPGRVTIAGYPSEEMPPKTLNSVLRQAGLKK
jgi:predicted RNA binding protein YcfA (HicA-like mRNA interferase family)